MKISLPLVLLFLFCGVTNEVFAQTEIVFHPTHEPKKANAPYSDAVQAGNLFFLSGQIGMEHSTRTMVQPGITTETEQVVKNIKAVLEQHGMTLDNVVKCTVVLSTMEDFAAFNAVYSKYFTKKPARTTFAAKNLALNAKVEIDVIAVK
ncbi:Rid family detoxifying hydrolase [Croceivirga sp. JEA036]|uniref:Rid family detoxifying hydrolase n=1 Tax=Croceivirga sp. JEA036 TaxID=2721162 RepID=UPI00143A3A5D|nr:Rid family detoxifying hydrolase [Croceivirga sp. JEA036]NJB37308.1 RidA family protein [Croceivirga sp. JEA036]